MVEGGGGSVMTMEVGCLSNLFLDYSAFNMRGYYKTLPKVLHTYIEETLTH